MPKPRIVIYVEDSGAILEVVADQEIDVLITEVAERDHPELNVLVDAYTVSEVFDVTPLVDLVKTRCEYRRYEEGRADTPLFDKKG